MSAFKKPGLFLLLLLLISSSGFAQKTIRGSVLDAETGEVLPSANILIEGTYRGTISNRNGHYSLTIPDSLLPADILVRYIGYKSVTRTITRSSDPVQDFKLAGDVAELGEIVVTDEDPALDIMREVIERKREWRKKLETYKTDAYTRQSLANDTSIVMITETISKAFWDKERGHREVIRSKKQTANIEQADNFAGVSYLPNFYDDNIDIAGFELVGVTHPDALKFYDFKLVDQKSLDNRLVYEIKVTPKRKLQPLFKGTIHVLDEAYALLEVRLAPNDVVTFPPPVKGFSTFYEQQFNNYGQDFWLPVDVRINGDIKISMVGLEFPRITFRQLSRITNYQINTTLPDSVYQEEDLFSVDSTSVNNDSLFVRSINTVPLSEDEQQAYAELDSTATLEKAFKPSGFLARFVEDDEEDSGGDGMDLFGNIPGNISPHLRFNRVDELYVGVKYKITLFEKVRTYLLGGYSTGIEEADYAAGAYYPFQPARNVSQRIGFDLRYETQPRFPSTIYSPGFTFMPNLFGARNYFDYFRNEGVEVYTRLRHKPTDLSLKLLYRNQEHSSLAATSGYDLFGKDDPVRINPPIDEGTLSSAGIELGYNVDEGYSFGATGRKRIKAALEFSDGALGSDFDFTRYTLAIDWTFNTLYRRRFLPNTLDIRLETGTSTGELPLQKFGSVDGALEYFSPFGVLKTIRDRPYEGDRYLAFNMEHNFRTIPFELLGLSFLAERNYGIIVFGGAGKTWFPEDKKNELQSLGFTPRVPDDLHLEAGVSLNGVLGLFRVDFARRLDEPAFLVNLSVARFF